MSRENPDFPSPKSNFPCSKSNFLNSWTDFPQRLYKFPQWLSEVLWRLSDFRLWLSAFHDAFLLSATLFCFPQRLSYIPQRLFNFPWRLSTFQEIREIYLWRQLYKRLLFKLRNSLPLCSPSFVIATRSPSIIIATMPTSHPTKAIRMSRCKFGGINISPANFTPMKHISHM